MALNKDVDKTGKPAESKTETKVTKVETKVDVRKTRKPVVDDSPFCVYIGPNIRGLVRTNAIYEGSKGEVIKQLADAIEKYPLIEKMVSPSKTFVEDRMKVKTAGNALNVYFNELVQQLN